jgi:carbonic anhydrase
METSTMTSVSPIVPPGRRTVLWAGAGAVLGLALLRQTAPRRARADEPPTGPAEALALLMDGNRRFVEGRPLYPNQSIDRREQVARGQRPFAVILGCVDSRVPPETVFDQGLGDLLVARTAGAIVSPEVIGSIEFGVATFDSPLVLVLGHTRCGAVVAAVDAVQSGSIPPGQIGSVVDAITPAVEEAKTQPGDLVANAVQATVLLSVSQLLAAEPIIAERIARGTVQVVGAEYDLASGEVRMLT